MEHKAWLWRRKSTEKTITANEKCNPSHVGTEQEKEKVIELERSLEELNEQLSYMRIECNAKDNLLAKQAAVVEESIAGLEKAKTEAESLKKELADVLLQKEAAEEKMLSIDMALKECLQQLCTVKEEHQHTTNDAATTISRVQGNAQVMEKRLAEANNHLSKLAVENSNLSRILEVKEKLVEDLTKCKSLIESSFAQLDKENTSLKYEVCILQKELEIRNQDRDFHIKSADAAHKKYLESLKKITKLESEGQKLRVMVRTRLPGPAAIAKMKTEVEILGNNAFDTTRKKPVLVSVNDCDSSSKKIASLIKRQRAIEDENKILKETVVKKNNELQSLRVVFAQTASKLSQMETQAKEFSKGQNSLAISQGDEDTINCSEAWDSALISELEHFKNGKAITPSSTTAGASELGLMDDFIEMEKLAIVCVDKQTESSNINTGEKISPLSPKGIATRKERVLVNTLSKQKLSRSDLEKTLCKIIEVMEEIIQKSFTNNNDLQLLAGKDENTSQHDAMFSPTKHVARIFMWEKSELCAVLQQFIVVCNDLLRGKADFKKFTCDLALTLEWIINHCFPIKDISIAEETIKNLFNGDYELESKLKEENMKLISGIREVESKKKELVQLLQSASAKNELLSTQLKDSDARISNLHAELVTLKCSNSLLEDQIENQELIAEELGTQLTVANAELCEARKKFYSLEIELEDKSNSCEELDATCLELQLQLASVVTNETPKSDKGQEEKQLRTDWEISAASEKLAECQATILNLGKQLKALASPKDAILFDKVIPPPSATKINKLSQLLDQTQDEDKSTKEAICTERKRLPLLATSENNQNAGLLYGRTLRANGGIGADTATKSIDPPSLVKSYEFNKRKGEDNVGKLVLVQKKQKGGINFLMKLLLRRKKIVQ